MRKNLAIFWRFMGGGRVPYIGAMLAVWVATMMMYAVPIIIKFAIDHAIGGAPLYGGKAVDLLDAVGGVELYLHSLVACGVLLVSFTAGQGAFSFLKGRWASIAAETVARNLRNRLFEHLQNLPFSYYKRVEIGDLVQRCTSDVEQIRLFVEQQSVEITRVALMVLLVVPYMLSINPMLTWVALTVVPLIVGFSVYFFKKVRRYYGETAQAEAAMSTVLQENLSGVRVVKAFSLQKFEQDKFDDHNLKFRDKTFHVIRIVSFYWGFSAFLCVLQIGAVLVVGVMLALGKLPSWCDTPFTVGDLSAFMAYEIALVWPIRLLGRMLSELGKAFVSIERINTVLSEPLEGAGEPKGIQPAIKGNFEFRNLGFRYRDDMPVLENISFKVEAGQTVGIIGPTGCGKSTLLNLIPRIYEYDQGEIRLDGVDLKKIDRKWLRQSMGIVLQEPFLFSRTVEENIRLGAEQHGTEAVIKAAEMAVVHQAISEFKEDYQTMVGEKGVTLSGGQKQRVAIARALLGGPPVLIFDDSLSAVDSETDIEIRKQLQKQGGKSTIFIVSHRISTVAAADLILVLEEGKITQRGNHEQLLKETNGLYSRLWDIQNEQ